MSKVFRANSYETIVNESRNELILKYDEKICTVHLKMLPVIHTKLQKVVIQI